MTEQPIPHDSDAAIGEWLGRADVWGEPSPDVEQRVLAAIAAEAGPAPSRAAARRRRPALWWAAAAAAVVVVTAAVLVTARGGDLDGDVNVALAATEAAPGATGEAALSSTPAGLKILLDTDGLEPAPAGFYYELWVSNGEIRVSGGTFHLRREGGPIELWAGVVDPSFDTIAITLEPVDGDTDSSGDVRLRGTYRLAGD